MSEVFCAYCAQGVACRDDACQVRAQQARDRNALSGWGLDPEMKRRTALILTEQAKLLVREEVHAALKTLAPSPQDDPYWVGHRAGTARLAEKDQELYASQTELAEVRAQLQEAQALLRVLQHQQPAAPTPECQYGESFCGDTGCPTHGIDQPAAPEPSVGCKD